MSKVGMTISLRPCRRHGSVELLLEEQRAAERRVERITGEPRVPVGGERRGVTLEHLEREFATSALACERLDAREQRRRDAAAPERRPHDQVVDVEQRAGAKGRYAEKAMG